MQVWEPGERLARWVPMTADVIQRGRLREIDRRRQGQGGGVNPVQYVGQRSHWTGTKLGVPQSYEERTWSVPQVTMEPRRHVREEASEEVWRASGLLWDGGAKCQGPSGHRVILPKASGYQSRFSQSPLVSIGLSVSSQDLVNCWE